jgi:TonB family protein
MVTEPEIRKAWERDRAYHKRLIRIVPFAMLIVLLLFLTSDQVSITELEKHVGFKGEMKLLPEISIIPDEDPFTSVEKRSQLKLLRSMELDVVEGPELDKTDVIEEELPEDEEIPEVELDDFEIATRRKQREVPYTDTYIILKMVQPEYPVYELENGIEGSVTVEMFVNEGGYVEMATVLSSIGPESFEKSSLDAVRQFVFQPPKRGDVPTSMWIKFLIKFRIYR